MQHDRIAASLVLDGAINGVVFRAQVEQFLAPTLHRVGSVIADNLASHKFAGVQEAIEACGASLLFLPAYSPDLNLIEQAFAKFTRLIRCAAPRSHETLWNTIGRTLQRFSSAECANYIANADYTRSA